MGLELEPVSKFSNTRQRIQYSGWVCKSSINKSCIPTKLFSLEHEFVTGRSGGRRLWYILVPGLARQREKEVQI